MSCVTVSSSVSVRAPVDRLRGGVSTGPSVIATSMDPALNWLGSRSSPETCALGIESIFGRAEADVEGLS